MAGGGIKPGVLHGAADEIGFHAVENRHYAPDIHAAVLHQLGIDPKQSMPGRNAWKSTSVSPFMAFSPMGPCRQR
jgi:uncharacterized protein DUF1501